MALNKPAHRSDRPTFDAVREEIGEDPARFICVRTDFAMARIRGIDRIDVARAWIPVVVELGDRGRISESEVEFLVGGLNRRIQHLREGNERPCDEELRRIADRSRAQRTVEEDDGRDDWEQLTAAERHQRRLRGETPPDEVATDGGEWV